MAVHVLNDNLTKRDENTHSHITMTKPDGSTTLGTIHN